MVWTLHTRLFLEQWLRRDSGMVPIQPHEGDAQKGTLYPPTLPGPTLSSSHHRFAVLEPFISSPITCTDLESSITSHPTMIHHSNPIAVVRNASRGCTELPTPCPSQCPTPGLLFPLTRSHRVLPPSPSTTAASRWAKAPLPLC